mgnify:CR=1 FL=1|jgi:hypothetical protein
MEKCLGIIGGHGSNAAYEYCNKYKPDSTKIHVSSSQLSFLLK